MSSFGESLRRERELGGIDLREVAEATKISVRFLQALENGRLDILPGGIFPRAFMRQYAAYLGLDPEKTVADFMYSSGAAGAEPMAAAPRVAPVTRTRPVPVGAALGALGILVLALLAWRQLRGDGAAPAPSAAPTVGAPPAFPSDRVFPPPTATPPATLAAHDDLMLDLVARQECWVAVQTDGVRVIDRVLAQGERLRVNARREFVLRGRAKQPRLAELARKIRRDILDRVGNQAVKAAAHVVDQVQLARRILAKAHDRQTRIDQLAACARLRRSRPPVNATNVMARMLGGSPTSHPDCGLMFSATACGSARVGPEGRRSIDGQTEGRGHRREESG